MDDFGWILVNLLAAFVAGSIIGVERSAHGRPAGFRTHALVCLSSALLMVAANHVDQWLGSVDASRVDPTRVAQGIMEGIGFLGAGVIIKKGLTIQNLTTAASIWTTAAIGILFGVGLSSLGVMAATLTLATLGVMRLMESFIPAQIFTLHELCFAPDRVMGEPDVRKLIEDHGFAIKHMNYAQEDDRAFRYSMEIATMNPGDLGRLAADLRQREDVASFSLLPRGD